MELGVGAAMSCFSSGGQEGFLGKGGETRGRHLASREQLLLLGRPRVEASAFCGRGFLEWSRRRGSSLAEF